MIWLPWSEDKINGICVSRKTQFVDGIDNHIPNSLGGQGFALRVSWVTYSSLVN